MKKLSEGSKCFYLTHLFEGGAKVFFMAEGVVSTTINDRHCHVVNKLNNRAFSCANIDIIPYTTENIKNDYIRVRTQGRILSHKHIKGVGLAYYTDFINYNPKYVGRLDCPAYINI